MRTIVLKRKVTAKPKAGQMKRSEHRNGKNKERKELNESTRRRTILVPDNGMVIPNS